MESQEFLIMGLNNAYAMEKGIEQALRSMIADSRGYPAFQKGLRDHLTETKGHARMVGQRIKELHGDIADTKKFVAQATSFVQGMGMKVMPHKSLKHLGIAYATEHLEISTYLQLHAIADSLGDTKTARLCTRIMADELAMAKRIERVLPGVVQKEMSMSVS